MQRLTLFSLFFLLSFGVVQAHDGSTHQHYHVNNNNIVTHSHPHNDNHHTDEPEALPLVSGSNNQVFISPELQPNAFVLVDGQVGIFQGMSDQGVLTFLIDGVEDSTYTAVPQIIEIAP